MSSESVPQLTNRAQHRAAARGDDLAQTRWLTTADVAARTGQGRRTIQRWIATGRLHALRPGGRNYRVTEEDLDELIECTRVTGCGDDAA